MGILQVFQQWVVGVPVQVVAANNKRRPRAALSQTHKDWGSHACLATTLMVGPAVPLCAGLSASMNEPLFSSLAT